MVIHTAKAGETLSSAAALYGVPAGILAGINGLEPGSPLAAGQTLVIRFPREVHTVLSGESVYSIALHYGQSVRTLYQNNPSLGGRGAIYPGETLVIAYDDMPRRTIAVNAYSYPNIDISLLDTTLPFLTYLTPFTYGITAQGTLVPLADELLLAAAPHYRTAALMHLSTLTEAGRFDSDRAAAVLGNEDLQDTLIRSVLKTLQEKRYFGLDVDFEYIPPALREAYAAFIARMCQALEPLGYPVITALAPKTSAEQRGLLYEAHDYSLIGAAANAVFLMTYEWGYTYGPPMAVAPLPQVRAVLDYAVREIAPEKIFMGIPLYGYDWPLPFVQGETRASSISPVEAVERALHYDIAIQYDETAQAPYFYYTDGTGREHAVWFEDARSIEAKLLLAEEYGLQGVGYWNLTRRFPQNWAVLASLFDIETLL